MDGEPSGIRRLISKLTWSKKGTTPQERLETGDWEEEGGSVDPGSDDDGSPRDR